jgi:hypothetical protein
MSGTNESSSTHQALKIILIRFAFVLKNATLEPGMEGDPTTPTNAAQDQNGHQNGKKGNAVHQNANGKNSKGTAANVNLDHKWGEWGDSGEKF